MSHIRTTHFTILVASALLLGGSATHAAGTPEQQCQAGRYKAAARYAACEQKALAKYFGGGDYTKFQATVSKCLVKYTAAWAKLEAKATGSGATCDAARFLDNGDGTVTDKLTALQWEKKTNLDSTPNPGDRHDADNHYSWSATGTAADGTAFTDFLATLNSGGCFAGQCDWRLPTIQEFQTIVDLGAGCGGSPCIDPIFGPTVYSGYGSATTDASLPGFVWGVDFSNGSVLQGGDKSSSGLLVRAVRAGL